jgi:hypothetical protein
MTPFRSFNSSRGAGCHQHAMGHAWERYMDAAAIPLLKKQAARFLNWDLNTRGMFASAEQIKAGFKAVLEKFGGGPVGINTIAASIPRSSASPVLLVSRAQAAPSSRRKPAPFSTRPRRDDAAFPTDGEHSWRKESPASPS